MKKQIGVGIIAISLFVSVGSLAQAAALTEVQIQAIISLVASFGGDAATLKNVEASLRGQSTQSCGNGNDYYDGGEGTDTLTYSGKRSEYVITKNIDGSFTVKDTVPCRADTDTVVNIELFKFSDIVQSSEGLVSSNCVTLSHNLVIGSTDVATQGEVSKLQQFLGVSPTGYYGSLTAQAVMQWQKANGMDYVTTKSGVGPTTRGKMKCAPESSIGLDARMQVLAGILSYNSNRSIPTRFHVGPTTASAYVAFRDQGDLLVRAFGIDPAATIGDSCQWNVEAAVEVINRGTDIVNGVITDAATLVRVIKQEMPIQKCP